MMMPYLVCMVAGQKLVYGGGGMAPFSVNMGCFFLAPSPWDLQQSTFILFCVLKQDTANLVADRHGV
jgi:hypothetical protein